MIETPFNYTGSKFKLLPQILPHFDYHKTNLIDLFCGGGSVYTNLLDKYDSIIINDIIRELIDIHKNIMESDDIINKTIDLCPKKDDSKGFLDLRKSFNENKSAEKL
jgi:site-specific DNA-adenine methylase